MENALCLNRLKRIFWKINNRKVILIKTSLLNVLNLNSNLQPRTALKFLIFDIYILIY
jgi:hypothetical protein